MADVTIDTTSVSLNGNSDFAGSISLIAGSAINVVAPCYISSDGKLYPASASGSVCDGFAGKTYVSGQAATVFGKGMIFSASASSLTPGQNLYLSTTAGALATTATNSQAAIARAISTTDIIVL